MYEYEKQTYMLYLVFLELHSDPLLTCPTVFHHLRGRNANKMTDTELYFKHPPSNQLVFLASTYPLHIVLSFSVLDLLISTCEQTSCHANSIEREQICN